MSNQKRHLKKWFVLVPSYEVVQNANGSESVKFLKEKRFFLAGVGASSANETNGGSLEEKNDITSELSSSSYKEGSLSLKISSSLNTADPLHASLYSSYLKGQIANTKYDVIIVDEFVSIDGEPSKLFARKFETIIPMSSIGGDGQSDIAIEYTITSSGTLKRGYVDVDTSYDIKTSSLSENCFVEEDVDNIALNLEPTSQLSADTDVAPEVEPELEADNTTDTDTNVVPEIDENISGNIEENVLEDVEKDIVEDIE